MTQASTLRCDCGRQADVVPTESPWEFDWRCVCGWAGSISWAHAHPPPVFRGETLPLFADEAPAALRDGAARSEGA